MPIHTLIYNILSIGVPLVIAAMVLVVLIRGE